MNSADPETRRLPALLLAAFIIAWLVLAIEPRYRQDWALENVVVVLAVALLVATYRRRPLRDETYVLLFAFLLLHEVGAHYTYSEVPYDAWSRMLIGVSPDEAMNLSRNHYDRFLHFVYGVAIVPAVLEWLAPVMSTRGRWHKALAVAVVMASSVVYELIEWAAALVFGGDLGLAYVGAQGDAWDAQHDMALAALGATVGVLLSDLSPGKRASRSRTHVA